MLTREQIMAMEAGPEMDRAVAERVFAWHWEKIDESTAKHIESALHKVDRAPRLVPPGMGYWSGEIVPPYSTDIAAAWEVVEKGKGLDDADGYRRCYFQIDQNAIGYTVMYQHKDNDGHTTRHHSVTRATAPHAICVAALLATLTP